MGKEGVTEEKRVQSFGFPPSEEEIRELSKKREGEIESFPFPFLLLAHYLGQRSLLLELQKGRISKKIVIDFGTPVDCQSNLVHETFGRYLASLNKLSEEEANEFFSESIAKEIPLGELLVAKGKLNHTELYRLLQQNLAKKLLDLFLWPSGTFRLLFDVPESQSSLKVNVPQLILTGISRFAAIDEVNRFLSPLVGKKLLKASEPLIDVKDLKLNASSLRILDLLRKPLRMDELMTESNIPYEEYSRLLYSLSLLGIVTPEEREKRKPVKALPEAAPATQEKEAEKKPEPEPKKVEVQPKSAEGLDKIREDIHKEYLSFKSRDPFQLLGVSDSAGISQIKEAFLYFSSRFNPDKFESKELADLKEKASQIFLAGAKAFGALADEEMRAKLAKQKIEERQKSFAAPQSSKENVYKELLDAKSQFKIAKGLREQGKHKEALNYFEFACDLDPQNSDYGAELALARYLFSEGLAPRAVKELNEIIRRDKGCAMAFLNIGMILAGEKQFEEAKRALTEAHRLMPKDPRPKEIIDQMEKKKDGFWRK
jgi:tetratricopeptide (TPR) repeat protein